MCLARRSRVGSKSGMSCVYYDTKVSIGHHGTNRPPMMRVMTCRHNLGDSVIARSLVLATVLRPCTDTRRLHPQAGVQNLG